MTPETVQQQMPEMTVPSIPGWNTSSPKTEFAKMFDFKDERSVESRLNAIIEGSPKLIRDVSAASATSATLERLMMLYSTVVISGSIAPEAYIVYSNRRQYLTLMLMTILPPASGKGVLNMTRLLLKGINDYLKSHYDKALREFKIRSREETENSDGIPLQWPKLKMVLGPGNSSSARLIQALSDNAGKEILTIQESEMDAFGISASSEFGSMNSVVLRQAFHHESISKMVKKDSELLEISTPKLSVVLSGTKNQVNKILRSNSDGLFSRFLFLQGEVAIEWRDGRPCSECPQTDSEYILLSEEYLKAWRYFKDREPEIIFSDDQWDKLRDFGELYLHTSHQFAGESATSIAKRHALMACRMAGIFSILRSYDEGGNAEKISCTDHDFDSALWLTEFSIKNALDVYKQLPGEQQQRDTASGKFRLLSNLPPKFSVESIGSIRERLQIPERSLYRWLSELSKGGFLLKTERGVYEITPRGLAVLAVGSNSEKLNKTENEN